MRGRELSVRARMYRPRSLISLPILFPAYVPLPSLCSQLQLTASKYDTVAVPEFPQYSPAHPERSRHNFESFLAALVSQSEPVLWNDLADWVRLPEKLELMASHREFMRRRKSDVPAPGGGAVGAVMALLGSSPPSITVAASAAPVAPAPSSSLPKSSSSSGGSAAPYGWMLIGVSVSAWMRWMSSTAAAAAASPAPYSSRSSSSRRISIPAIDEEGEEENDSPAPATYVVCSRSQPQQQRPCLSWQK